MTTAIRPFIFRITVYEGDIQIVIELGSSDVFRCGLIFVFLTDVIREFCPCRYLNGFFAMPQPHR